MHVSNSNFGSVLDGIPLIEKFLFKTIRRVKGLGGSYLGMEDEGNTPNNNNVSSLSTTPLLCGLCTIIFMSIVPTH